MGRGGSMRESAIKMLGLAAMMLSVFLILFGAHAAEAGAPEPLGMILVIVGLAALLVGLVLKLVLKKD